MRAAEKAGELHESSFAKRYGWMCGNYVTNMYWWDLWLLEARFIEFIAALVADGMRGSIICLVTSIIILALQMTRKPFLESDIQAAHWTSPNKVATLSYVSQIMLLVSGIVSEMVDMGDDSTTLSAANVLLLIISVPAIFIPVAISVILFLGLASPDEEAETSKTTEALGAEEEDSNVNDGDQSENTDAETVKYDNPMVEINDKK